MRRRPGVALLLFAALGTAACDGSTALARLGHRSLREIEAERARAWVEEGRAVLVQVRDEDERLPRLPGALALDAAAAVPDDLRAAEGWVVVVGSQRDAALELAARLAREGLPRVAIASGDLTALAPLLSPVRRAEAPVHLERAGPHPSATTAGDRPQGDEQRWPTSWK
jgi:hypothetical protein